MQRLLLRPSSSSPIIALLTTTLLQLQQAHGAYDNYPIKSINLDSAPNVDYYETYSLNNNLFDYFADPHAVHGSETSDGGYVVCGKATESESGGATSNAFVVKLNANGSYGWGWQSNLGGKLDACNAVVELPNGGGILAVGYQQDGSNNAKRALKFLNPANGNLEGTVLFGSSNGNKPHGAWEMAQVTEDGYLLLGGLTNSNDVTEFWFKSYGNVFDGQAIVQKYNLNDVSPSMTESNALFTHEVPSAYVTCKSAKTTSDGKTVALLYSEENNAALTLLDVDGAVLWGPTPYSNVEGTDVAVSAGGTEFAITGHGGPSGIAGKLLRINASDGTLLDTKLFYSVPSTAGSDYQYVYNECWGIQPLSDGGYVLACGTGIEECSVFPSGQLRRKCNRNEALLLDDRSGAIPRPASIWQAMTVRTDSLGDVVWQRVDQWSETGNTPTEYHSSAAEWAILGADGSIVTVNDEETGIGLFKLVAPAGTTTTTQATTAGTTTTTTTEAPPTTTTTTTTTNPPPATTTTTTTTTNPPPTTTTTTTTTTNPPPTTTTTTSTTTTTTTTPNPQTCVDSPFKMIHGNNESERSCNWVANKLSRRCGNNGIASHCPSTCDGEVSSCNTYGCENSLKTFVVDGEWYHCDDACDDPEFYCGFEGVPETCGKVCGYCNNGVTDPECGVR